jgi:fructose-bisphosphate aldolase class II
MHMRDMLQHAYRKLYVVAAFDLVSLDFLQAIVGAAQSCQAPIILSVAQSQISIKDPGTRFTDYEQSGMAKT